VNFEHRPWWYGGHFCQKAGKNLDEKTISNWKKKWVGENDGKK